MKKLLPYILLAACSACTLDNVDQVVECTKEGEARFYPGEDGSCVYQKCVDKTWTNDDSIVCGNVSCQKVGEKGEFACGECLNNSTEFNLDGTQCTRRTCGDGRWSDYMPEESTLFCGQCNDGEITCEDSTEKSCVDGKWKMTPCPNGYPCSGKKCSECKDGQEKYVDLPDFKCQKLICVGGAWKEDSICENHVSCRHEDKSTTICGECTNYTFSTGEKELYTCINGKNETNEECKKPSIGGGKERFVVLGEYVACKFSSIGGFAANTDDKIDCYNQYENSKLVGHLRKDNSPCANNYSCHVISVNYTECGECVELETRCNNKLPQTCINGLWTTDLPEWHTADRCANDE